MELVREELIDSDTINKMKFFRKNFYALLLTSALMVFFGVILAPQIVSATGFQCHGAGVCYNTLPNCYDAETSCNAPYSCISTSCTPGSNPTQPPTPPDGGVRPGNPSDGGVRPGSGNSLSLPNPLGDASTIPQLLQRIMNFLIIIATPLAGIMVLWSAYQILTAAGDEEKFKKGKKTLLYVVIGFALIVISSGIVSIVTGVLNGDTLGSSSTSDNVGSTNQIGDSCTSDFNCAPGLFCNFSAGMPGHCSATPIGGSGGQGTSCASAADCIFPLRCQLSSGPNSPLVCNP